MKIRPELVVLPMVLLVFALIWLALSIPVVEWSWTSKECIRVIPPEAGTCDQLPDRYEPVWVR